MDRRPFRIGVVGLVSLLVLCAILARATPTVEAGDDVCPESNDDFQHACNLGPGADALGFISTPDDVDAYRIVALDFNTRVRVQLVEQPAHYRLVLANWNGEAIGASEDGAAVPTIEATVPMPGAYYVFVDSPYGAASDSLPYRLGVRFTYIAGAPPVLYSGEFRDDGRAEGFVGSNDRATFSEVSGTYIVALKVSGAPQAGQAHASLLGPTVRDFVMTVDARVRAGSNAGYQLVFRSVDGNNFLRFIGDTTDGRGEVLKLINGQGSVITNWTSAPAINRSGGVNRTSIKMVGGDIRVNVNGTEILRAVDTSIPAGRFGLGAVTWAEPATYHFDNLLITAPATR